MAAALLAAADSGPPLATLLAALGVGGVPRTLDANRRDALGITAALPDAQVAAGPGMMRALLGRLSSGPPAREQLPRLAARLQSRAPHVFWIVALTDDRDGTIALAAWSGDRRPPKVRSLVVHRATILDSDAETVCALAGAASDHDALMHLRWTEVLGRDALCARFYRELERRVSAIAASAPRTVADEDRRALALLHTSRLLFLAFLEVKGWLDGRAGFLAEQFDQRMTRGGGFHAQTLRALFFGTLNTPRAHRAAEARAFGRVPFLNGGLFAPTALERRHRTLCFGDEPFGELIGGLFARYRFTAREDAATWSDAAIDPEMLGHAFESLMAGSDRRDSGAFFTPQHLVERVTDSALEQLLRNVGLPDTDAVALLSDETAACGDQPAVLRALSHVALLDPACGSGAFLVHTLGRLAHLRRRLGDDRPAADIRRDVVTRSLFGVDRNPMAVWLCELRLWLSVVIESEPADPMTVAPLPNLDRNVRVGDALSGTAFDASTPVGRLVEVSSLRRRYSRATGARKSTLGQCLDRLERVRASAAVHRALNAAQHERRERILSRRGRDLFGERGTFSANDRRALDALRVRIAALQRERRRLADGGALPFSFAVHFADVAARGGFDAVVGNPPWVRLHRVPAGERAALRRKYTVFRNAAWVSGAEGASAGSGFASQADLSALFVERGVALLKPSGALALLVPAKLWRSLAGGGVRRLLMERTHIARVEDLSDAPSAFDAAVYPSILAAHARVADVAGATQPRHRATYAVQHGETIAQWRAMPSAVALDDTPGSPWLLLPPPVRRAFDRLCDVGMTFLECPAGRPMLGVKCGCNDVFVVTVLSRDGDVARVTSAAGTGDIEARLLRPLVRGETVTPWRAGTGAECIIWPYHANGTPLSELPPLAARWIGRHRRRLLARADARGSRIWWTLFRTESAAADTPRVVWADFGRRPRAAVIPAGSDTVPLNTCYVARCADIEDARTLAAILNSPVAAAWLHALAEPARGGFRRYLAWTIARLPMPRDWAGARRILAPIAADLERQRDPEGVSPSLLANAVLRAYGLRRGDVAPLLAWSTR